MQKLTNLQLFNSEEQGRALFRYLNWLVFDKNKWGDWPPSWEFCICEDCIEIEISVFNHPNVPWENMWNEP